MMRKRWGLLLQAVSGALLFLLAGASDAGVVSVAGLACGAGGAVLLYAAGCGLRRVKPADRCRLTVIIPLHPRAWRGAAPRG